MKRSVSLRHAAAVYLFAWALLQPPVFPQTDPSAKNCAHGMCLDVSAPLDRWPLRGGSYSEAECREEKARLIKQAIYWSERFHATQPDLQVKELELARCIYTEFPRK